jgi:hypothetical protein
MPLSAPTVVARYRLPVGRQGFLYHIHTISRCVKVLFVSDNIFYSIVVRCFERTWVATRAHSIVIQLEGRER